MTKTETAAEALARIESGFSQNDIISVCYFAECGIKPDDITPRENVLTFKAWKAKGRSVAKGAKGLPVTVWIPSKKKTDSGKDKMFPRTTRLFHVSQTIELEAEKGTKCAADGNEYLVDAEKEHDEKRVALVERVTTEAKAAVDASKAEAERVEATAAIETASSPEPISMELPKPKQQSLFGDDVEIESDTWKPEQTAISVAGTVVALVDSKRVAEAKVESFDGDFGKRGDDRPQTCNCPMIGVMTNVDCPLHGGR